MNTDNVLKLLWSGVKSRPKNQRFSQDPASVLLHKIKKEETDSDVEEIFSPTLTETSIDSSAKGRKSKNIRVKGRNIPEPLKKFNQLINDYGVDSTIVDNLISAGYETPTPIQMQAIPVLMTGRQVLACAPTGSGKTIAFLVPVIAALKRPSKKGFRALILSPTRELAKQIYRECTLVASGTGIKANYITKIREDDSQHGSKYSRKFDILVSTPNRLVHLLRLKPDLLNLGTVEWLIVDESDKLFETGMRGFRDQLAEIFKACDNESVKRAMFSATYTVHVARWCRKTLKKVIEINVGQRNTTVDNVDQDLVYVGNESGKLHAFRELINQGIKPPVLVFVQSKDRAKDLFKELIYDGINVDVIHSERTQQQRDNVVRAFREGKIWVLICTDILGRGIDFIGIKLVINYDFPNSAISYIHRIGRTGRAGLPGQAVTFFTDDDRPTLRTIATVMKDSGCPVPDYMLSLKKVNRREKAKMEGRVPEREPISTEIPKFKRKKNKISTEN